MRFMGQEADDVAQLAKRLQAYSDLGVKYILALIIQRIGAPALADFLTPLILNGGNTVSGRLTLPEQPTVAVSVIIGTYHGASTGDIEVTLCAPNDACGQGRANLAAAVDNQALRIALDKPFAFSGQVSWTLRHPAGAPVAIWMHDTPTGAAPTFAQSPRRLPTPPRWSTRMR